MTGQKRLFVTAVVIDIHDDGLLRSRRSTNGRTFYTGMESPLDIFILLNDLPTSTGYRTKCVGGELKEKTADLRYRLIAACLDQ